MRTLFLFAAMLFGSALMWQGCQEDIVSWRTKVPHTYKNRYANLLFRQMQDKKGAYKALQEALGRHEADYEHVKVLTHSHYGVCYFIPYTDAGSAKVTGAVYYPVDATISDDNIVHFTGNFGTPEAYDADRINNKVGILEGRFLYSAEFLLLEEEGVEVDPALSKWAHFLNNRFIHFDESNTEYTPTFEHFKVDTISFGWELAPNFDYRPKSGVNGMAGDPERIIVKMMKEIVSGLPEVVREELKERDVSLNFYFNAQGEIFYIYFRIRKDGGWPLLPEAQWLDIYHKVQGLKLDLSKLELLDNFEWGDGGTYPLSKYLQNAETE